MGAEWIGLIGAVLGALVSGVSTYLVASVKLGQERADAITTERLKRYTAVIDAGEAAVHRFERIARGWVDVGTEAESATRAIALYDEELTRSLQLLRLSAPTHVEEAATRYRRRVSRIRRMFIRAVSTTHSNPMPVASDHRYQTAMSEYRRARRELIALARKDLGFAHLREFDRSPSH